MRQCWVLSILHVCEESTNRRGFVCLGGGGGGGGECTERLNMRGNPIQVNKLMISKCSIYRVITARISDELAPNPRRSVSPQVNPLLLRGENKNTLSFSFFVLFFLRKICIWYYQSHHYNNAVEGYKVKHMNKSRTIFVNICCQFVFLILYIRLFYRHCSNPHLL